MESETIHKKDIVILVLLLYMLVTVVWFIQKTRTSTNTYYQTQEMVCAEQPTPTVQLLPGKQTIVIPHAVTQNISPTPSIFDTQTGIQSGTCTASINGVFFVDSSVGTLCRQINNKTIQFCVPNTTECEPATGISNFIKQTEQTLSTCASTTNAKVDNNKSCVTSSVLFEPGLCEIPPFIPSCVDDTKTCENDTVCDTINNQ
jgi:hypothetical protein